VAEDKGLAMPERAQACRVIFVTILPVLKAVDYDKAREHFVNAHSVRCAVQKTEICRVRVMLQNHTAPDVLAAAVYRFNIGTARLVLTQCVPRQVKKVIENFTALAQKKPPPELQPITPVKVTRPTPEPGLPQQACATSPEYRDSLAAFWPLNKTRTFCIQKPARADTPPSVYTEASDCHSLRDSGSSGRGALLLNAAARATARVLHVAGT